MNRKCPKCGAELILDNNNKKLKCEYCRSNFDLEEIKKELYICEDCGIQVISSSNLTSCIYCNSKKITQKDYNSKNNINYIVPFKITKKEATTAFKKMCKNKWFMPKSFNINKKSQEIKSLYIPFSLCNCDTTGVLETECDKINTWNSGGYKYTKTDKYKSIRGGNISFENILVNFSNNFNNEMLDTINPFDLTKMKCFEDNYYKDFLIEENIKNKDTITKEIQNKTKNYFKEEMKKDIKKYNQIKEIDSSINLYNLDISYILLPVWFLNIKHRKKSYMFLMNGQTGKINNNVPIDKTRIVFLWVSSFIIIFSLLILLSLIKVTL